MNCSTQLSPMIIQFRVRHILGFILLPKTELPKFLSLLVKPQVLVTTSICALIQQPLVTHGYFDLHKGKIQFFIPTSLTLTPQ